MRGFVMFAFGLSAVSCFHSPKLMTGRPTLKRICASDPQRSQSEATDPAERSADKANDGANEDDAVVSALVNNFQQDQGLDEDLIIVDAGKLPDLSEFASAAEDSDGAEDAASLSRSERRRRKRQMLQDAAAARENNPLSQLQDVSRTDVLDTASKFAWAGIAALIGWELLINSPIFQRKAKYNAFPTPGEESSVSNTKAES